MKLTLERQIPLVFGIVILVLGIIIFFAFSSMNSLSDALTRNKRTQEVISQLDETLILVLNAENGTRAFMITGDEAILEPYLQARGNVGDTLNRLRRLTNDNQNQTKRISELEDLINQRIILLGEVVEARRSKSLDEVRKQFASSGGKEQAATVRRLIGEMKSEEQNLFTQRETDLNQRVTITYWMLFVVGFAGLLSLGFSNVAILREIKKRRRAEEELRDTNKDLENRVEKRTLELSQKNEELEEVIEKREELENAREELFKNEQTARREAEIANRLRDEFLATVSHELRAPLNSILGWGRLLEKGKIDAQTSEKAIQTIVRNAEAQNRLIEDLLDVSRIISGKLRLEVMTIKPINFVEAALETVRPAAQAKNITLEIKEDPVVSHISGDPTRLQQIVWNLLSNAIKFTPAGGKVTVEIERMNGFTDIRVKDTGIGITAEFLPHVFDRFRQADASSIRKFGGLGLGLAIVRHITEMHGGTVSAHSDGENKGATFTVRLPVTAAPKDVEGIEIKPFSNNLLSESSPNLSLDGLLILVVDDEEDTRQLLVQSLTFYGATVVTAKSAEEGLSELQKKNPDVLVSDIGMPDEDGYSFIRKIRALDDEHHKNTTAIALTAFARAQDRMRALAAGYQNHVGKPVELDELATVIASLTGRLQMDEA